MGELASEAGISKATLYRWTGSREQLLSEVLIYFSQNGFADALAKTEHLRGADRVLEVGRRYLQTIVTFEPLRRFLQSEPLLAMRLLTVRGGAVQTDAVRMTTELLATEHTEHGMPLRAPAETLAYAIVRIGEGFIYNDQVADIEPDVETALSIVRLLVK